MGAAPPCPQGGALETFSFCRGCPEPSGLPGLVPADEVLSLTPEKVPKEQGIPRPAGRGTRRWGDFSHARKVTKSAPEGGRTPLGYPPRSVALRASLSGVRDSRLRRFHRRPPASCLLRLRCLRPRVPASTGIALRHSAPLEVQTRRLEHHDQAPIGGGQGDRSSRQKAGGRRAWQGVSAGGRRSIETGTNFAPP